MQTKFLSPHCRGICCCSGIDHLLPLTLLWITVSGLSLEEFFHPHPEVMYFDVVNSILSSRVGWEISLGLTVLW